MFGASAEGVGSGAQETGNSIRRWESEERRSVLGVGERAQVIEGSVVRREGFVYDTGFMAAVLAGPRKESTS
jgi:hypothetical protein